MGRELSIVESYARAIDQIKRSRRSRDKDSAGWIFDFDQTITQLVHSLPELCTGNWSGLVVHAVRELSADCFAEYSQFRAAKGGMIAIRGQDINAGDCNHEDCRGNKVGSLAPSRR
jgi:hypothetical protein